MQDTVIEGESLKKKNWTIERIIYVILKLPKKYGKGSIGE